MTPPSRAVEPPHKSDAHKTHAHNTDSARVPLQSPTPQHPPPNALDISGLSMAYGNHTALHAITLSVASGSITAIIGPNGAGKSSMVRTICGRQPIKTGKISIYGMDAHARAARANLGVAPQTTALYPQLTARENLISFARQAGMSLSDARTRTHAVLDLIGMSDHDAVRAHAMSGGMRQRVNIGAAVMHSPKLVILDEPVSSLDPGGTQQVNRLICRLRDEGFGVLLITHDMDQALHLPDLLVVLQNGTIAASGQPHTIVEQFCGTQINLFLTTPDQMLAEHHGFRICPERPGCWRKTLADKAMLSTQIPRLIEAGIALDQLNIVSGNLGDVLAVLEQRAHRTQTNNDDSAMDEPPTQAGCSSAQPTEF